MAMFNELNIEKYRGIKNLKIEKLNHVNLIVGDNNCGKTSLLEAIQLLNPKASSGDVYKLARQRDMLSFLNANSIYENFICMFPHDGSDLEIHISGFCNKKYIAFDLEGAEEKILLDPKELDRFIMRELDLSNDLETDSFKGQLSSRYGGETRDEMININRLVGVSGTKTTSSNKLKIVYVSPFEHLKGNVISQVIKNDSYKEICIKAIQLFDENIEDMMIFKSDVGNRPVEYIKHKTLGNMPLSTYGDGIKKVLVLANAIAKAAGGILLIDEVETAIHKKYYDDIFSFIIKACQAFDVQLFITTHSLEAIDGLLMTQNYDEQNNYDAIDVITLKRNEGNTYARVLPGREVAANREDFGFEVRL